MSDITEVCLLLLCGEKFGEPKKTESLGGIVLWKIWKTLYAPASRVLNLCRRD